MKKLSAVIIVMLMVAVLAYLALVWQDLHDRHAPAAKAISADTVATDIIPAATTTVALADQQVIDLLRKEAHKRGLKWRIYCTNQWEWEQAPVQSGFQAEAVPKDGAFSFLVENGSKGMWVERGRTQADAAYKLYLSIQRSQNFPAEHRAPPPHKKICPPELRGD